MKFAIYTNAEGRVGPIMAVLACDNLEMDDFESVEMDDLHPTGGKMWVVTCKSRAGNSKMWNFYWEQVNSHVDAERKKLSVLDGGNCKGVPGGHGRAGDGRRLRRGESGGAGSTRRQPSHSYGKHSTIKRLTLRT